MNMFIGRLQGEIQEGRADISVRFAAENASIWGNILTENFSFGFRDGVQKYGSLVVD